MCVSLKGPVKAEIIMLQDKGKRPHDDVDGMLMMQKLKTMLPVMMETASDDCQSHKTRTYLLNGQLIKRPV